MQYGIFYNESNHLWYLKRRKFFRWHDVTRLDGRAMSYASEQHAMRAIGQVILNDNPVRKGRVK
jgi:hypothetical protein